MTQTIDQFVEFWTGKEKCDFDGSYGNQCVDLFRFYTRDVLGFPQLPPVGGASEFSTNFNPTYFDWVKNLTNLVPSKGDVIIWGSSTGNTFGHVAICLEASPTANTFKSFDLNFPSEGYLDSKKNFIGTGKPHTQVHKWSEKPLGWLVPKATIPAEKTYTQTEWQIERDERNKNWDLYKEALEDADTYKAEAATRKADFESFTGLLAQKLTLPTTADRSDILASVERLLSVEEAKRLLEKKLDEEQAAHDRIFNDMVDRANALQLALDKQDKENATLRGQVEDLKKQAQEAQGHQESISWIQKLLELFRRKV